MTSLLDSAPEAAQLLAAANRAFTATYPGPTANRQPVHTVYAGAQLYRWDTTARLGRTALQALQAYGSDPIEFARCVGLIGAAASAALDSGALQTRFERDPEALHRAQPDAWLAFAVHQRVLQKPGREPVEAFRIDFEDGSGARPDAEEAATAESPARKVARGMAAGSLPPFLGIR